MTRQQLLASVSQSEFNDWLAVQSIDPFFNAWMANAINCQVTAAAAGSKIAVEKFLPVKPAKRPPTAAEVRAVLRQGSRQNGTD